MSKEEELVRVARITGVHGIKGELKATPYGELDSVQWDAAFLSGKGEDKPVRVLRVRRHKGSWLFLLEGCVDRTAAEALVGLWMAVRRSDLPPPGKDEYYYFDLVGMEVLSEDGAAIGSITGVISTGGNDVLEVSGPLGEVLIPAVEDIIVRVEPEGRRIIVRLIEGLLPEQSEGRPGKTDEQ